MSPKLDERITTLKDKLKQLELRKQRIAARQRALQARRDRKQDTRRKILAGAVVLTRVAEGKLSEVEFRAWLDAALTRPDDRALFDLPSATGGGEPLQLKPPKDT